MSRRPVRGPGASILLAAAALSGLACPAGAQQGAYYGTPYGTGYGTAYGYQFTPGGPGYPLSLPQTLRATIAVPLGARPDGAADTLAALYPRLAACFAWPGDLGRAGVQVTARFALRRDGSLIGPPRITYATGVGEGDRPALVRAAIEGVEACAPVPITPGLGRAIAGRPVALRLVYRPRDARGPA